MYCTCVLHCVLCFIYICSLEWLNNSLVKGISIYFYQLLMSASETQLSGLGLRKDPKAYHFFNQGDSNRVIQV